MTSGFRIFHFDYGEHNLTSSSLIWPHTSIRVLWDRAGLPETKELSCFECIQSLRDVSGCPKTSKVQTSAPPPPQIERHGSCRLLSVKPTFAFADDGDGPLGATDVEDIIALAS